MNKAIKEWRQTTQIGIQLTFRKIIQTILYTDNQVTVAVSEDVLQIAANELNKTGKKYDMKISTIKIKTIRLCGKNIQRAKTETKGKIIQ
jgi:hypothetical protein